MDMNTPANLYAGMNDDSEGVMVQSEVAAEMRLGWENGMEDERVEMGQNTRERVQASSVETVGKPLDIEW